MDKEKIIAIVSEIISEGYNLESTASLAGDTCVVFKRKQRWIYPENVYLTSFIENTFLFSSDEFAYRVNMSGRTLPEQVVVADDCRLVSIGDESDISDDEMEEIEAEIERAIENDELYIWDEIILEIAESILTYESDTVKKQSAIIETKRPTIFERIAEVTCNFKQLLFLAGF